MRAERIKQCCKRVRIWRRQISNPLVQFKQQQQQSKGGSKKNDRRMHISLLMSLIIDIYEARIVYELDECSQYSIEESFPEFVVRYITLKSGNRFAQRTACYSFPP